MKAIKIFGNSEQDSTEGYNLWNPESYNYQSGANMATLIEYNENTIIYKSDTGTYNQMSINTSFGKLKAGKYKISYSKLLCRLKSNGVIEDGKLSSVSIFKNGSKICSNLTFAVDDEEAEYTFACSGISAINGMVGLLEFSIQNPMLSLENQEFYEPYTGGQPSPRPDYPQPIRNVGKYNEETGKYDVDVIVLDGEESGRKQTVTITSDRPITIFDRLEKQDGVYGWLYGAKETLLSSFKNWALPNDNRPDDRTRRIFNAFPDAVPNQHCYSEEYKSVKPNVSAIKTYDYECIAVANGNYLTLKVDKNIGTTLKEYVEYFKQNDSKVLYHSVNKDFVPLSEEEQNAIERLSTYYPTTVISAGDGEMYGDVELTYIADTKNYIDNQIKAVTGKQIETNKLILERMI